MSNSTVTDDKVRGVVREGRDGLLVFAPSGTNYELHLDADRPVVAGSKVIGRISADAMRIHAASGGGKFIEPIIGQPRIVQGRLIFSDSEQNRLLIDLGVPVWLHLGDAQSASEFELRSMLNCYVRSGASIELIKD